MSRYVVPGITKAHIREAISEYNSVVDFRLYGPGAYWHADSDICTKHVCDDDYAAIVEMIKESQKLHPEYKIKRSQLHWFVCASAIRKAAIKT
jgi:hypothetical protein